VPDELVLLYPMNRKEISSAAAALTDDELYHTIFRFPKQKSNLKRKCGEADRRKNCLVVPPDKS